jgi:hypothetical protein
MLQIGISIISTGHIKDQAGSGQLIEVRDPMDGYLND